MKKTEKKTDRTRPVGQYQRSNTYVQLEKQEEDRERSLMK